MSNPSSHPEHNYAAPLLEVLMNQATGVGKLRRVTPISLERLSKFKGVPSLRTLQELKCKHMLTDNDSSPSTKIGRPELLPEPERLITGGWALRRLEKGNIVTGQSIIAFLEVRIFYPQLFPHYV